MKAMVLAAGFGTRLGEVGRTTPKCLMQAGGKTLLQHVIDNLRRAGVDEVVINLHHLGDHIERFIGAQKSLGVRVHFSREERILGTGGGIKHAREFFAGDDVFLVHNGDVFTDLDLKSMIAFHRAERPLASLAVIERAGGRQLLFDGGRLCGWESKENNEPSIIGTPKSIERRVFSGIHAISPEIFDFMQGEEGEFSIIRSYIAGARAGRAVRAFALKDAYWIDGGTPERLAELSRHLAAKGG